MGLDGAVGPMRVRGIGLMTYALKKIILAAVWFEERPGVVTDER